jgi:hypothetical protein
MVVDFYERRYLVVVVAVGLDPGVKNNNQRNRRWMTLTDGPGHK